jgi:hypothetical protein
MQKKKFETNLNKRSEPKEYTKITKSDLAEHLGNGGVVKDLYTKEKNCY